MGLSRPERRNLKRIEHRLNRSDPLLGSEFWAFGKICPGQAVPDWEQFVPERTGRWPALFRRLSRGALLALAYAGGATGLDDPEAVYQNQQAKRR